MLKEFLVSWRGAPKALRWFIATCLVLSLASVLLMPKIAGVVRFTLTLALFYHLILKGTVANSLAPIFMGGASVLAIWHASASRPIFGALALFYAGFAIYLMYSSAFKSWLSAVPNQDLFTSKE